VGFLERLMKECILFAGQPSHTGDSKMGEGGDDLFGSAPGETSTL
jgi:hypothetical protein